MMLGNVLWEWVTVGDRVKQRAFFFLVAAFQLREKERTPFAQFIHAAVPGDLEEPGFEWGLGMSRGEGQREFRERDIQLQKDLLQDIIGLLIIFEATANKVVQGSPIAINQALKGVIIANKCLCDECMI